MERSPAADISREQPVSEQFTIGQVARLTGIPTKAIRYYEKVGLLPPAPRQENGYRNYSQADIERLIRLRRLRMLGRLLDLSLDALKPLLSEASDAQGVAIQQEGLCLIEERLRAIDHELVILHLLHEQIERSQQQLFASDPDARTARMEYQKQQWPKHSSLSPSRSLSTQPQK